MRFLAHTVCKHVYSGHINKHGLTMCTVSMSEDSFAAHTSPAFVDTSTERAETACAVVPWRTVTLAAPLLQLSGGLPSFPVIICDLSCGLQGPSQPGGTLPASPHLSSHFLDQRFTQLQPQCPPWCSSYTIFCSPSGLYDRTTW